LHYDSGSVGGAPARDENGCSVRQVDSLRSRHVLRGDPRSKPGEARHACAHGLGRRATPRGTSDANRALRRLNQTLEEQATRIAYALHDESGQILAAVHLALGQLESELPPGFHDRIRDVRGLLTQAEQQLRRFSHELRPPMLDNLGLVAALQFLADGLSARSELPIELDCSLAHCPPREIELVLYRVVQEALTNATRHAHASRVLVRLRQLPDHIECSVRDDGVGLEHRRPRVGLGLLGVHDRLESVGGTLEIHSAAGKGTDLIASIPLGGASG